MSSTPSVRPMLPEAGPPAETTGKREGVLSFFFGSVALALASMPYLWLLTIPLSALGLWLGLRAWRAAAAVKYWDFAVVGPSVSLTVLLLAGVWPLLARISALGNQPHFPAGPPERMAFPFGKKLRLTPFDSAKWADASKSAVNQGEVCLAVNTVRVEAPALLKNGQKMQSKAKKLVIRLQLVCMTTQREISFESWGMAPKRGGTHAPVLTGDTSKRKYPLAVFASDTSVVDQEAKPSLYPKLYADDVLVFEPPTGGLEDMSLELPASAFGASGSLRLFIPAAMIQESGKTN